MMRIAVTAVVVLAALAGVALAGARLAPCSPPSVYLNKTILHQTRTCPEETALVVKEIEPPAVTVATAKRRGFVDRLFVSGTLVAREEAQVSARMDGVTIVELDAEDGDLVKAGQVLARLDSTQLEAQLAQNDAAVARADAAIEQAKSLIEQSQAQRNFANDDFDRARRLGNTVMSTSQIEQRETSMKTAQAQLDSAQHALTVAQADRRARDAERRELQVRLSRTEVVAPVSGLVSRRSAKVGATVTNSGEPLFRIIEDGAIELEAEVAEQALPKLAVGMKREAQAARRSRRCRRARAHRQPGGRQEQSHRQGSDHPFRRQPRANWRLRLGRSGSGRSRRRRGSGLFAEN